MDGVHNIKGINSGSVKVGLHGGGIGWVLSEEELPRSRLAGRRRLISLERDGVISTMSIRACRLIVNNFFFGFDRDPNMLTR